jgi:hypothetical protein
MLVMDYISLLFFMAIKLFQNDLLKTKFKELTQIDSSIEIYKIIIEKDKSR